MVHYQKSDQLPPEHPPPKKDKAVEEENLQPPWY
jgi:hypothetical protein